MPIPIYSEVASAYEFLVRWNDGVITGAHVGFRTKTFKDGIMIADQVDSVMPVDIGSGKGFPLDDILSQIHIDALALCDEKQSALELAMQRISELEAQLNNQG